MPKLLQLFLQFRLRFGILPEVQEVGHVGIVRRRLAEIIKAGPHEFSRHKRILIQRLELVVHQGRPAGRIGVIGCHLKVRQLFIAWNKIDTARTAGGGSLAPVKRLGGILLGKTAIHARIIILPKHVKLVHKIGIEILDMIRPHRGRTSGVFIMGDADQLGDKRNRLLLALLIDFVAQAPEDDAGMIAVAPIFGAQVLLMPVLKQIVIVVRLFALQPAIE
jgi:hypothetical protein